MISAILEFVHADTYEVVGSVVLQPRSLLVFRDLAYTGYKHRMRACDCDTVTGNVVNAEMAGVQIGDSWQRSNRVCLFRYFT